MITQSFVESVDHQSAPNGELRICCPFEDDTDFHMYVNLNKKVYFCHKCNAKGRVFNNSNNIDSSIIEKYKHTLNAYQPDRKIDTTNSMDRMIEKKEIKNLPLNFQLNMMGRRYLEDRGFSSTDFPFTPVSGESVDGKFKDTVIFPIYHSPKVEEHKLFELKYYVARRITDQKPRYINAPWEKKDTLYVCPIISYPVVFITEGIFDAVSINKAGYYSISILGKRATTDQLERIVKEYKGQALVICLDRDAFSAAVKLKLELAQTFVGNGIHLLVLPDQNDPADILRKSGPKTLRGILDDFLIKHRLIKKT